MTSVRSKVYDIGFKRYRSKKIRICGKESIPLFEIIYAAELPPMRVQ